MFTKLKSVISWFSGKKTTIGATALVAAQLLPESITQDPEIASKVGQAVIVVGLLHKLLKQLQKLMA